MKYLDVGLVVALLVVVIALGFSERRYKGLKDKYKILSDAKESYVRKWVAEQAPEKEVPEIKWEYVDKDILLREELMKDMPDFSDRVRIVEVSLLSDECGNYFVHYKNEKNTWISGRPWSYALGMCGLRVSLEQADNVQDAIIKHFEEVWIFNNIPDREIRILSDADKLFESGAKIIKSEVGR